MISTDTQLDLFPDPPDALPPHTYPVPTGRVVQCRSCNAAIVWATTGSGARVPLSLATKHQVAGQWVATSHYRDCPHASAWGKRGSNGEP